MISQLTFETARLSVENWDRILGNPAKRNKLESELKVLLTPKIMYRLPLSMKFSLNEDSITNWVDDRINEVQILCVHARDTAELVGLVLLFDNPEETRIPTVQLGYILGEPNWGKGYATEMIKALIAAMKSGSRMRLHRASPAHPCGLSHARRRMWPRHAGRRAGVPWVSPGRPRHLADHGLARLRRSGRPGVTNRLRSR